MTQRARLALGLSAAALVAAALWTWSGAPDARPARPYTEPEPVAAIAAGPAAPDEIATADAPLEEARPERGRRAIAEGLSIEPEERVDDPSGRLRVLVRSRDTGEPLAGVRVFIEPVGDDVGSTTRSDGARESEVTADDGLVEFEAALGQDHALRATRVGIYRDIAEASVSALSRAETRDIVLEFPTAYDLPFVGRVVASEGGEPLPGASYSIGGLIRGSTDANGYFEAFVPSWQAFWVMVEAPGHARAITETRRGQGSRAEAQVIRLHRSARLSALVLARDGTPLEGVRVHLTTSSRNVNQSSSGPGRVYLGDLEWTGQTGADGRCSVGELPPFAELEVECSQPAGFRRRERDPLQLAPGEVREVVFRIGSGATIVGRLIDASGEEVEGVAVWLEPAEASAPTFFAFRDPVAETVTRAGGWFELADVADGTWWVGPAPRGPYPAIPELVDVIHGVPDRTVLLEVTRGLFIEGRVVEHSGAPIAEAIVSLRDEDGPLWLSDQTDAKGEFSIGPLARGSYLVSARGSGWVPSGPIRVEAGDGAVVVHLEVGGSIRGTLVDGDSGAATEGQVRVSAAGAASRTVSTDAAGRFEVEGLEAGRYHVSATTETREFALATNVAVAAGVQPSEILLRAWPGAMLHVRYAGDRSHGWFQALVGDAVVAAAGVERDGLESLVVPAGVLRVESSWEGLAAPEVRELTLVAGEERELTFGGE